MITIERVSPEEMLRRSAAVAATAAASSPRVANTDAALQLHAVLPFRFRGRRIPVRPLPFHDGVLLMQLAERAEEASRRGDWRAYGQAAFEAMDICWRNAGPRWLPRWVQRLRRNPFRRASIAEVGDILRFFALCQT
ncbi:MAG TPA: hypothetical protein VIL46_10345, partial [Gemmataceae bacterium]